jgi:hypothetical protein
VLPQTAALSGTTPYLQHLRHVSIVVVLLSLPRQQARARARVCVRHVGCGACMPGRCSRVDQHTCLHCSSCASRRRRVSSALCSADEALLPSLVRRDPCARHGEGRAQQHAQEGGGAVRPCLGAGLHLGAVVACADIVRVTARGGMRLLGPLQAGVHLLQLLL